VRVVSWNVHRCFGVDRHYRPERILEVLQSIDADVIALQEIDSSLRTANGENQLSYVARGLGMDAVMGPTLTRDYGAYGNAILTRFDIDLSEEHDLSYRKFEPRGAVAIEARRPAGLIRIVNTHLGLKYWERSFQIDRLLGELAWGHGKVQPSEMLVVVLGDFNEWMPYTGNAMRLERAFEAKSPRMATFPSNWPRFALDRVFLSHPVSGFKTEVLRNSVTRVASDHLPLIVSFDDKSF
jgi:endonuclease/exonuclease/phosphatase family metal-dependent hydrolase